MKFNMGQIRKKLKQAFEPLDMNDLVSKLLAFPPHLPSSEPFKVEEFDHQILGIKKLLEDVSAEELTGSMQDGGSLLDIFDPSRHTLPYGYALIALCQAAQGKSRKIVPLLQPSGGLWQALVRFLESFDPIQIRYCGPHYLSAIEYVYYGARDTGQAHLGIHPIRTAMLRLDPSTETLTSAHRLLAHLCLLSKAYGEGLPILDNDIYHFPASTNPALRNKLPPPGSNLEFSSAYITSSSGHSKKLTHRSTLEYYMYAAMIYMCLKNWERALFFLEACITMPTQNVASMIQVEAYRKYLLVGLIHTGAPLAMPKNTNSQAARNMKYLSRPYEAVSDAFKSGTQDRLRGEIEEAMQVWQVDNNTSLVLQVFSSFRKYALIRLSNTYAALSIPAIMALTPPSPIHPSNPTETETYIANLIASGFLSAILIPSTTTSDAAILRFTSHYSEEEQSSLEYEEQIERMLAERTADIKQIARHMRATGEMLEMSKEYVDWIRKVKKEKDGGQGKTVDLTGMPGGGATFVDEDEELMGDI